jgi:Ran GTPase-activating protein (RanGAP) involved in mRNA processing and transport
LFLNVKGNTIGNEGKRSLGKAIKDSNVQFLVCDEWSLTPDTTELDVHGKNLQAVDTILLGGVISNNGAMTSLNMSKNSMKGAAAGKALGGALATNTVLKELDLSGQSGTSKRPARPNMDAAFVKAFVPGLSDNGTLMKLDISENNLYAAGVKALAEGLKGNEVMTELNLAGNEMGKDSEYVLAKSDSVIALADAIRGMEALLFLNVKGNTIGNEGKQSLGQAIKDSNVQFFVCDEWSLTPDTTELDVHGKNLQSVDTILLGGVISNNGALAKFVFSGDDNSKSITMETAMTVAEFKGKGLGVSGVTMLSAFLPKCM